MVDTVGCVTIDWFIDGVFITIGLTNNFTAVREGKVANVTWFAPFLPSWLELCECPF